MLKAGLYIIGTPIGNLGDMTLRAIETLGNADFILAEDTRHTRILLERYLTSNQLFNGGQTCGEPTSERLGPASPSNLSAKVSYVLTKRPDLVSCHKFNEQSRVNFVLEQIRAGKSVALVTNAGMPAVADPGARVVSACRRNGLYVTVIPGPSVVTAAVALSGFGGDGFVCEGFLSRKKGRRMKRLAELKNLDAPAVIFESPYRLLTLLDELHEIFQDREIFVGRELTKFNEQCLWGTAAEIRRSFSERDLKRGERAVKGELALVIAPAAGSSVRLAGQSDPSREGSVPPSAKLPA